MPSRLSDAEIFRSNQAWYEDTGASAWGDDKVPYYAASNAGSARATAEVVAAFASEVGAPVQIVEIGCGSGRFGFLLALELEELLPQGGWTLTLTDAAPSLVDAVRSNDAFQRLEHPERVRFEVLDAVEAPTVGGDGPLVLVANYLIDSLPQDAFLQVDGALQEVHYDPALAAVPAPLEPYGEPALDAVVRRRAESLAADGPFTVPVAGLRLLEAAAQGRPAFLGIVADRGWVRDAEIPRQLPVFDGHNGAVSLMVDLCALQAWGELAGWGLLPAPRPAHVHWVTVARGLPSDGATARMARRVFDETSPMDHVYAFTSAVWAGKSLVYRLVFAHLRLARWDPDAFLWIQEALSNELSGEVQGFRSALFDLLQDVLARRYDVPGRLPLEPAVAAVYRAHGAYAEAEALLVARIGRAGGTAALWRDVAGCRQALGRLPDALEALDQALACDPFDEEARMLRERMARRRKR